MGLLQLGYNFLSLVLSYKNCTHSQIYAYSTNRPTDHSDLTQMVGQLALRGIIIVFVQFLKSRLIRNWKSFLMIILYLTGIEDPPTDELIISLGKFVTLIDTRLPLPSKWLIKGGYTGVARIVNGEVENGLSNTFLLPRPHFTAIISPSFGPQRPFNQPLSPHKFLHIIGLMSF